MGFRLLEIQKMAKNKGFFELLRTAIKMAAVDKTGVFPFSVCVSGKISAGGELYSSVE